MSCDVERQVMAADIAVARDGRLTVGGLVLEHLEIGSRAAPVEAQLAHDGARVDVEMLAHPVVVVLVRPERVDVRATQHPDEEVVGFLQVGHGEPDVIGADQSRQRHAALLACGSNMDTIGQIPAIFDPNLAKVDPIGVP